LAYCNFIIDPKLKYLIKIEISNSSKNGYLLIGLMDDEHKELKLLYELNLAFSNYSKVYGLTKKIKGECFTQSFRNVERFELHIQMCLEDKQFVVYDFSEKKNIFALPESAIQDKKYRLGFELYYAADAITIKELQIVESFSFLAWSILCVSCQSKCVVICCCCWKCNHILIINKIIFSHIIILIINRGLLEYYYLATFL